MATNATSWVRKRREALRPAGMRPAQMWVPDSRQPAFIEECRRQSALLTGDAAEAETLAWIEAASDTEGRVGNSGFPACQEALTSLNSSG